MDEKMMKLGGEAKRKELIKQMEDLSVEDRLKMTDEEEFKGKFGDMGQAEGLMSKKKGKYQ